MRFLKISTAANIMVFMADSSDHVTGKASLTLTITASKDGAAFASISPTVTERGSGWYNLALTSSHTDTLGDLALHITGTGADPTDLACRIVAVDHASATGFVSSVPTVVGAVGSVTGNVGGNVAGSVASVTADVGITQAGADKVWGSAARTLTTPDDPAEATIKKNTAYSNFSFALFDTDGNPATGKAVTATRSIDGAAFGACANAVSEVANGGYKINFANTDLNGDNILFRFAASGCRDVFISILPES